MTTLDEPQEGPVIAPHAVVDPLTAYKAAQTALKAREAELEAELRKIRAAMSNGTPKPLQRVRTAPVRPITGLSLRDAVVKVLGNGKLTKREILQRLPGAGYRFTTKDPLNSLNAMIYSADGKKYFQRHGEGVGARFSAR